MPNQSMEPTPKVFASRQAQLRYAFDVDPSETIVKNSSVAQHDCEFKIDMAAPPGKDRHV